MEEFDFAGKALTYGTSKLKDVIKTREEYKRFEKAFVECGEAICSYEADKSERYQKLTFILSAKNMEELAGIVFSMDVLMWKKVAERKLYEKCTQNELSEKEADKCVEEFIHLLKQALSKYLPDKFSTMMIADIDEHLEILGERGERWFKSLEQVSSQIISNISSLAEKLEDKQSESDGCEVEEPIDFHGIVKGIPVNDNTEWELRETESYRMFAEAEERKDEIQKLTSQWGEERKKYPGFYILPYEKADELRRKTDTVGLLSQRESVDASDMLDFIFEYCWRWNRSLFIISAYDCKQIYLFFEDYEETFRDMNNVDAYKLYQWFFVGLCLLRDAREELDFSKWEDIYELLDIYKDSLGAYEEDFGQILWLERVRMLLYRMRIRETVAQIKEKKASISSWHVRLQTAGILAECGEVKEALKYLEELKKEIKHSMQENAGEEKEDLQTLTLLSCVYQLQEYLISAVSFAEFWREDTEKGEKKQLENWLAEVEKEKREVMSFFSLDEELAHIQAAMLQWLYNVDRKKKMPFDISKETVTLISMGEPSCEAAYYMYRMLELMALPIEIKKVYQLPQNLIYYMQKAIFGMCPKLGIYLLLRGDNEDYINRYINHDFLIQRSSQEVEEILDYVMQAFRYNMQEFKHYNHPSEQNLYTSLLKNGIELFIRFSSRCGDYQFADLLQIVADLMNENCIIDFGKMDNLLYYISLYVPESIKAEKLNMFLGTAMIQRIPVGRKSQIDIFEMLNRNEETTYLFKEASVNETYIDKLLSKRIRNPKENEIRLERLIELYRFGKIKSHQVQSFIDILWKSRSEETGLPDLPDRYLFSFLELPHPEGVDVLGLVKKAIFKYPWKQKLDGKGHLITMGNVRYFKEISGLCNYFSKKGIACFSLDEALMLIRQFADYWTVNKDKIVPENINNSDVAEEFFVRFENLQSVIAEIMKCCEEQKNQELNETVQGLYEDMKGKGIASAYVRVLVGGEKERNDCIEEMLEILYRGKKTRAALDGLYHILTNHLLEKEKEDELLIQILRIAKTGKEKGLASLLIMIHNLFYSNKMSFSKNALKETGKILEYIPEEFVYEECDGEKQMKTYVLIRHFTALLAYDVYKYCKSRQLVEPPGVQSWREICRGDEFMDVKNAYMGKLQE